MKFIGGYNILLEGEPSGEKVTHLEPDILHLPLFSGSLEFTALQVEDGEKVKQGQVLAEDPVNFFVPLLAPRDGIVNLNTEERHITLENLSGDGRGVADDSINLSEKKKALVRLGVWSSMARLDTGKTPDPENAPDALVITISRNEPFFPNPNVFLKEQCDQFSDGLKIIHKALDDTAIYLVASLTESDISNYLRQAVEDHGDWATLIEVPEKYPNENPALNAQLLKLNHAKTWVLDAQAVLAAEQAINKGIPAVNRIVSVGGPAVQQPRHFEMPIGSPLSQLIGDHTQRSGLRIIDGGVLTGRTVSEEQKGLDVECFALTILEENNDREVLAFANPGFNKHGYTRTFASIFRPFFREKYSTALHGEARPCIFCGSCEDVCPAGLIPHLIYRYLSNDRPEDAYRVGLSQCVECGLCSYVCVSKIEHLNTFREEKVKSVSEYAGK